MDNEEKHVRKQVKGNPANRNISFACTMRARLRGLLGCADHQGVLALAPCHDVHTFGMQRPLDIAFASAEGAILEAHRNVPPRRRLRCRQAVVVLERFADDASPWFEQGERLELQSTHAERDRRGTPSRKELSEQCD